MIFQPSKKSPRATTKSDGLMSSIDKVKLNNTNIAYGTCVTAASTAAKVVKITGNENWDLFPGSIITVKFTYTNVASNPTLNVNDKGAMPIIYNTSNISTSNLAFAGSANRYITYVYTGSAFAFIGWSIDNNTTYSNATTSAAGLMSAADKKKLDEIDTMKGATTESLTLSASNWDSNTQEVSSSVATEDNVIIVSPTPDDQDTYSNCGIKCSAQAEGSLAFTCKTLPTIDIHVNVVTFR